MQLIDGGETACGRLWFAMEPVFGERIDHYVRNRRLALDRRLALFEAVCDAVEYAHARRLIHGDIKPDNLLVDETGRPRLLDFGIASSEAERVAGVRRAMTPVYASPEQRAGGAMTATSDVYQLGMLMRHLVLPDGAPCSTLPRMPGKAVVAKLSAIVERAQSASARQRFASVAALRSAVAIRRGQ